MDEIIKLIMMLIMMLIIKLIHVDELIKSQFKMMFRACNLN